MVTAPGRPSPMMRPSMRVTGLSSRVVLVMNASSAVSRSAGNSVSLRTSTPTSWPTSNRNARVIPSSRPGLGCGRQRRTAPHQEEVRLRALGQLAAIVAHQAFFGAAAVRLLHRQRIVQQVVRLDDRVDRAGMVAQDRHEGDGDAVA